MRHKFRWGVFLTILLLALISSTLVAQAEQTTEIAVGTAEGTAKETVSVTVSLDGNAGLCALHLTLSYDSDALTLKSVSEKGLFGRWYESDEQLSTVPYQMLWISADSVDATGELVVFTFEIAEDAELGVYPIDLTVTEALDGNGNNVTVPVQDGSVTVRCAHSFGDWSKTDDLQHSRECVHCGESESAEHNWYQKAVHANGACDEQATADYACRNCEITKTEAYPASGAHIYSTWEDRNDGTHIRSCRVCGKEESGEHTWNDGVVYAKEPCDETGIVRYTCTECNVTREEDYVPTGEHQWQNCISAGSALHVYQCAVCAKVKEALHEWDEGTLNTTKPCDENAKITYRCSCCNETKIEGSTPTAPHSYGAWEKKDGALHVHTCSECGKVESQEHVWEMSGLHIKDMCDENGTVEYECESCGAEKTEAYIPAKEHVYGDWQQNDVLLHKRACRYCGKAQIVEHRWDDGTIDGLGACDENGELVYACVDCGAMRREDFLPTASHIYGDYTKVDGTLHQRVCTVCEKIDTKSHTWRTEAEHILGPCDEAGTVDYACSSCNAKKTAAYVPAENHTFEEWMQHDATLHKRVCQVCSKVETNEHRWNSGTVERLGYCDENGRIVYTCIDCGITRTEQFSPTDPHTYGDYYQKDDFFHEHTCMICQKTEAWEHSWNVIEESCLGACDENATVTRNCSVCGVVKVEKMVPTATHQYGECNQIDDYFHQRICTVCQNAEILGHVWSTVEENTRGACDEEGSITRSCSGCGVVKVEKILPTATHQYGAYNKVDDYFHQHTCTVCQKTEVREHAWSVSEEHILGPCDENGTVDMQCADCNATYTKAYMPTDTHAFEAWNAVDAATHQRICTGCGKLETSVHTWDKGTIHIEICGSVGTIEYVCTSCGYTYSEEYASNAEHVYAYQKKDEQTHTYECMLCHNDKGTSDHRWNNGVTSIKGACDENGTITYTCIDCSATKTENYVPTSAHTFGAWMRQDGERHKHTCMVCEKSESADHRWNNGVPSIKGTCDETGKVSYTCTDCGATKTEAYVPTSPHTFGEWSRQNDEMHRHTCTACGKSERADHRWDEGFSSIGGICDENGTTTYTCIDCGMIRIVYYQPQAPHSYEMWERVDDQSHCRVCSTCGREETRAHDWIGGEIHASAACDENGYRLYSCVACGISRQEPINPTSHSFGEWSYNATLHLMERVCLCGKKETQAGATTPPISAGGVQILPGQDLFLPVGTELIAEKLSDSAEDAVYETVMEQLAYLNQGATPFAAYDIYLMANGASVSAGNEITISIPTSAAEIERFESVSVYYLSDGGRLYACPTTVEDGAVHFTTLSNGRFLIVGKEAEPNRAWIWILVVGLVVLGGAVVAVLLLLKKKNTQATSSGSYQAKNSADVKSAGDATVSGQEKPRT